MCKTCKVKEFIDFAMAKLKDFDVWDVSIFKVCLIVFGMLIGMYHSKKCKKISPILWIAFMSAFIYLVIIIFFSKEKLIHLDR